MSSLFYDRATYCLTKRYAEPYVSAQMRPLVQGGQGVPSPLDDLGV